MNKGKVLRFCKECNKKKFVTKKRIPGNNLEFTCNKLHTWKIQGVTVERINLILNDLLSENRLNELFNRNDTFYSKLSRR